MRFFGCDMEFCHLKINISGMFALMVEPRDRIKNVLNRKSR